MIEKDDWRLFENRDFLIKKSVNPVDGEDITKHLSSVKKCIFCWDKVEDNINELWYIPNDKSCCICGECFRDFKEMFEWNILDGWDIDW